VRRRRLLGGRAILAGLVPLLLAVGCADDGSDPEAESAGSAAEVAVTSNLIYAEPHDGIPADRLIFDLYERAGDERDDRPVVVVLHGGAFVEGDKTNAAIVRWSEALARRGFVVAAANYRLVPNPGATTQELVEIGPLAIRDAQNGALADVRTLIGYLQEQAGPLGIDPDRIGALGFSAGGYLALGLAHRAGDEIEGSTGPDVEASVSVSGSIDDAEATSASPPVLVLHGRDDLVVPFEWAEEACAAIEGAGSPCTLEAFPGGHEIGLGRFDELEPLAAEFLAAHLEVSD
jgi:acetyl esterase/lipase